MNRDLHYVDPRLVELYDIENTWGPDSDFYLSLADELEARVVGGFGCGTGRVTRAVPAGRGVRGGESDPTQR
jgi:hypothetical protein